MQMNELEKRQNMIKLQLLTSSILLLFVVFGEHSSIEYGDVPSLSCLSMNLRYFMTSSSRRIRWIGSQKLV